MASASSRSKRNIGISSWPVIKPPPIRRASLLRSVRASGPKARRGSGGAVTGCLDGVAAAAQAPGDNFATLLRGFRLTCPETWLVSKAAVTSAISAHLASGSVHVPAWAHVRAACVDPDQRAAPRATGVVVQCDISVGTVIDDRMPRVAPPRTNSRNREWP